MQLLLLLDDESQKWDFILLREKKAEFGANFLETLIIYNNACRGNTFGLILIQIRFATPLHTTIKRLQILLYQVDLQCILS